MHGQRKDAVKQLTWRDRIPVQEEQGRTGSRATPAFRGRDTISVGGTEGHRQEHYHRPRGSSVTRSPAVEIDQNASGRSHTARSNCSRCPSNGRDRRWGNRVGTGSVWRRLGGQGHLRRVPRPDPPRFDTARSARNATRSSRSRGSSSKLSTKVTGVVKVSGGKADADPRTAPRAGGRARPFEA